MDDHYAHVQFGKNKQPHGLDGDFWLVAMNWFVPARLAHASDIGSDINVVRTLDVDQSLDQSSLLVGSSLHHDWLDWFSSFFFSSFYHKRFSSSFSFCC